MHKTTPPRWPLSWVSQTGYISLVIIRVKLMITQVHRLAIKWEKYFWRLLVSPLAILMIIPLGIIVWIQNKVLYKLNPHFGNQWNAAANWWLARLKLLNPKSSLDLD